MKCSVPAPKNPDGKQRRHLILHNGHIHSNVLWPLLSGYQTLCTHHKRQNTESISKIFFIFLTAG